MCSRKSQRDRHAARFGLGDVGCQGNAAKVGPPDPKDIATDAARDLAQLAADLNRTKEDARHWLTGSEYDALKHRLEDAHAAVEAALIEARRRVRMNEER